MPDRNRTGPEMDQALQTLANRIRRSALPVLVLTAPVTFSLDPLLASWAVKLQGMGLLAGREVRRYDLLPLLSSPEPMNRAAASLLRDRKRQDGLTLVDSFHQFGFSPERTRDLLNLLLCPPSQPLAPLVLHIPESALPDLLCLEPRLKKYIVRETGTPRASPVAPQEGYSPRQKPGRQGSLPPDDPNAPWYVRDPSLLKLEKEGMIHFLATQGITGKLKALPGSRRLRWTIYLPVNRRGANGFLTVFLVYSDHFSSARPDVGVALEPTEDPGLRHYLGANSRETFPNDREVGEICILERGTMFPSGAAVSALKRVRDLIFRYPPYNFGT